MAEIHDGNGLYGGGMNGTEIFVKYEGAFVRITLTGDNGHFEILMEVDRARRYFRDVNQQLGDP